MLLSTPDKQNADMRVRQPVALNDTDADYPALTMANYLLGSGGSSRLWKRIRETEGLSYDVRSQIGWNNFEPTRAGRPAPSSRRRTAPRSKRPSARRSRAR